MQQITLVAAIRDKLVPRIQSAGFAFRSEASPFKSGERKIAFPFPSLVRDRGGVLHLVEIQLERRGAAQFVVNFGVVPKSGLVLPWGKFDADVAEVSSLERSGRLYRIGGLRTWFGQFPATLIDSNQVETAARFFSEVEDWFTTGFHGKHTRAF